MTRIYPDYYLYYIYLYIYYIYLYIYYIYIIYLDYLSIKSRIRVRNDYRTGTKCSTSKSTCLFRQIGMVDTRISFAHDKINVSLGSHFLTVANNLFLFCLFIMQSSSLSITLFNFLYLEVSFSKFPFQRYVISLLFHLLVKEAFSFINFGHFTTND